MCAKNNKYFKTFIDDLGLSQYLVIGKAATLLQFIKTKLLMGDLPTLDG